MFFCRFYPCFAENITFKLVRIVFGHEISEFFAKKKKTCFSAQIDIKDTQEHLLIALFFLIVLTHEVDFGISNKNSARALIE